MIEIAGTLVVIILTLGLLARDELAARGRGRSTRPSKALWIPVLWLFIAGSRPLSGWLAGGLVDTTNIFLEGNPIDRAIFTGLIVSALVVLVARGRRVGTLLRANAPILLFLGYCALSIFWSDFPNVAFKRWVRAVGDVVMVLVVLTDPVPFAAVKGLLARAGFLILPLSILFDIVRAFTGREYHFGLTTSKNMFGMVSMILGLAAVWRFLMLLRSGGRQGRTRRLLAHGALVAMAMLCLWTADSATSTGCFLLGSMVIAATSWWSFARKPAIVHLVVASLIFAAVYATVLNPAVGIISTMGRDATLTGRTDVWQAVIPMNPSPWFGAGFESFWLGPRLEKLWHIFVWRPNEAHNGYIEVYLNLGWTGLILLAVVFVTGYGRIVSALRQNNETGGLRLAYFVGLIVYNLTEAGFRIFSPTWIMLLLSIAAVFRLRRKSAMSELATTGVGRLPQSLAADQRQAALVTGNHS